MCPAAGDSAASHGVKKRIQLRRGCSPDAVAAGSVTLSDGLLGAADHGLRVPLKPQPPHLQARHPVTTPGRNASATRLATGAASCAQIIAPRRLAPAERPQRVFVPLQSERRRNPAGCGLHLLKALEGEGGLQVPSGDAAGCPAVRPFRLQVVLQDHSEVGAQCMLAAHGLAPGFTALLCAPPSHLTVCSQQRGCPFRPLPRQQLQPRRMQIKRSRC